MTVEKPKPKQLLRPITTGAGSAMNQSQFVAIICISLKAREKSRVHGAIGFGFISLVEKLARVFWKLLYFVLLQGLVLFRFRHLKKPKQPLIWMAGFWCPSHFMLPRHRPKRNAEHSSQPSTCSTWGSNRYVDHGLYWAPITAGFGFVSFGLPILFIKLGGRPTWAKISLQKKDQTCLAMK